MSYLVEGPAVPLSEVAEQLGVDVEEITAEAASLMGPLGVDWRGRPAVRADEAASLVDGSARRNADHSRAHAAHSLRVEQWENTREQVRRDAYAEAYDESLRRGLGAPRASADAHPPAREAAEQYERQHHRPVFEQPSLPRRITKRVREAVTT